MLSLSRARGLARSVRPQAVWSPPTAICQGAFAESSLQGARRYARTAGRVKALILSPQAVIAPRKASRLASTVSATVKDVPKKREKLDMADFPLDRIRNLSIIAHIDHGKSTLADRLLQLTGTVPADANAQFLDKLKVERERGITVKAQTVSLIHRHTDGEEYLINLIDTPGHVDFSYEVSRSLGACEGGLLLVDGSQGIQAQTLSVYHHAVDADLTLLPVINKVDLPHADPAAASAEIAASLGLPVETHMRISAKSGLGVENVLGNIVDNLPAPEAWIGDGQGRLRGLVFDTFYDHFRGVVSLVRLFSGSVKKGDKVRFLQAGKKYEVLEVGVHNPEEIPVAELYEGQVGYVVCNMKNSDEAHIGDTMCLADKPVEALPGFKPMKAMVYAGVFPVDSNEFTRLEEAIERLTLNDRSVSVQRESSAALSQGFRLGFLGTLHMDVFRQRLEDEYESSVIITSPTVPFKVVYKDGREEYISNPAEFPDTTDPKMRVAHIEEPMVNATIFVPNSYIGQMMTLCSKYRGIQVEYKVLDSGLDSSSPSSSSASSSASSSERAVLRYTLPLSEIVTDFFSELKSESSGFASFDYEEAGYEQSDLVKLNMMLNSKPVDALAMIVHKNAAQTIGRVWTKKLRAVLPRQLFEVAIQAAVGSKVLARETLSAMRKDVTAGLYGGHYERKMKHLEKQKKGKMRLKKLAGNIDVPQSAFFEVLSSRPRGYATCSWQSQSETAPMLRAQSTERQYGSDTAAFGIAQVLHSARLPADGRNEAPADRDTAAVVAVSGSTTPSSVAPSPSGASTANVSTLEPILPPSLHPRTRSTLLSAVLRLADSRTATAPAIYNAWSELYLASPTSHAFTPVELGMVLQALHRAQRRDQTLRDVGRERTGNLQDELGQMRAKSIAAGRTSGMGSGERQGERSELEVLADYSTLSRRRQRISWLRVEHEAAELQRRFPVPPLGQDNGSTAESRTADDSLLTASRRPKPAQGLQKLKGKRREYARLTNALLLIAAKAEHNEVFEQWWGMRDEAQLRPDKFAVLARLTLLLRQGRLGEMKVFWRRVAGAPDRTAPEAGATNREADDIVDWSVPLPLDKADGAVLLNVVLWQLAKAGAWADVAAAYDQLRHNDQPHASPYLSSEDHATRLPFEPSRFMTVTGSNAGATMPIPRHLVPTSETYSLLIRALSYQGDLTGALSVMRHMFAAGLAPGVPEYCALFEGFARWGEIGKVDMDDGRGRRWKGDLDACVPKPIAYSSSSASASAPEALNRDKGEREGLADIWNRSAPFARRSSGSTFSEITTNSDSSNLWTADTLDVLFDTFLTLHPVAAGADSEAGQAKAADTAPSRVQVWAILLAFNRVFGGNARVVLDVFERLQRKFAQDGEPSSEGGATQRWEGWRVDGRIERTVAACRAL